MVQQRRGDPHPAAESGVYGAEGHRGDHHGLFPQAKGRRGREDDEQHGDAEDHPEGISFRAEHSWKEGQHWHSDEGTRL